MGAIHDFVSKRIRDGAGMDLGLAIGAAVAGLAMITVSFCASYAALAVLFFLLPFDVPDGSSLLGSLLFLALVFVESWRSQRKLFEEYSAEPGVGGVAGSAGLYMLGIGWGPTGILPLSPGTARKLPRAIADLLFSGPRLLRNTVRLLRRARERGSADVMDSARVLESVFQATGRVSLDEISTRYPEIDPPLALQQLSWLDGVIYLSSEPPGLTLTDTLRAQLERIVQDEAE